MTDDEEYHDPAKGHYDNHHHDRSTHTREMTPPNQACSTPPPAVRQVAGPPGKLQPTYIPAVKEMKVLMTITLSMRNSPNTHT
jgi:hypothetical protein